MNLVCIHIIHISLYCNLYLRKFTKILQIQHLPVETP